MVTAIETIGTIKGKHGLILDDSLPLGEKTRVRVIVFLDQNGDEDVDEKDWLRSAAENEAFEFLSDEDEDIYTLEDGKPV
ncbi:MAG TPA: hypothetical protein DEP46_15710 [Blastocatellia bacterium]|nr:hypothetical protein [Blastocatellia bacterium]